MDPGTHRRYLDYRELFIYFGRKTTIMSAKAFARADTEHRALAAKAKRLSAAEDTRFRELAGLLFRD